jgi:hypothetical protein
MKIVVVYESMFGNTKTIAEGIAAGFREAGEVKIGTVDVLSPGWLEEWSHQIGAGLKDGLRENPSWIAFALEDGTVYHTYTVAAPTRSSRPTSAPCSTGRRKPSPPSPAPGARTSTRTERPCRRRTRAASSHQQRHSLRCLLRIRRCTLYRFPPDGSPTRRGLQLLEVCGGERADHLILRLPGHVV